MRHAIFRNSTDEASLASWKGIESLWIEDLMDHPATSPDIEVLFSDMASILYTSGTTGRSKGVEMSHHYWYDIWSSSVKYSRYTEDDILYTGLPFFHGNAQGITIGPAILADAKAVIVERFSASSLLDDCRKWNCTEANYIGGIIPILMKQEPDEGDGDNPLRLMVGAAAPVDIWDDFESRFKTKLLEVYGMTECYCCLVVPYDEPRPGSCGKPITGWRVMLVDDNDNEVSPGEIGEFIAQPENMFVGLPVISSKSNQPWNFSKISGCTQAILASVTKTVIFISSIERNRPCVGVVRIYLLSKWKPFLIPILRYLNPVLSVSPLMSAKKMSRQ